MAALIGSGVAACGDATRALSPDQAVPVEQQEQGKDLQLAVRGELRSYPEHVIADFVTEFSPSITSDAKGLSYEWVFGDGKRVSGAKASHVFADTGKQEVVLRVTNAAGQVTQLTKVVQISASISQLGEAMVGIVPGGLNTCAVDAAGVPYCWGNNESGIIGDGTFQEHLTPVSLAADGIAFAQIASGFKHTCALSVTGQAYCWGRNFAGQLGDGTNIDHPLPLPVLSGLTFTTIDVGISHTCAVATSGAAYCWGTNELGQLGDGTSGTSRLSPTPVAGGHLFSVVRTGNQHTCGLELNTGVVFCWGANYHGQIGNGTGGASDTDAVTSPTMVASNKTFTQLDAGASHNCAVSSDKFVYCWGWNGSGQLGTTSNELCVINRPCTRTPTKLPASVKMSAIGLGTAHSCGLVGATGAVYCWGFNASGQLGDGTTVSKSAPTLVPGATLKSIRGGNGFTCGVGVDSHGYCWGINFAGTLGVGDTTNRLTPTQVPNLTF